jgi:hypothetical protein
MMIRHWLCLYLAIMVVVAMLLDVQAWHPLITLTLIMG